jgi:hypothetical protein
MRKLPGARDTEYSQLNERPPNNSGISGFALVSEFRLSFLFCVRWTVPKRRSLSLGRGEAQNVLAGILVLFECPSVGR